MAPDNSIAPTHGFVGSAVASLPVPTYLQEIYWWAYVHPWAVRVFEREWLVNMILLLTWAGHETTAGHVSWALIDLLQHPEALERVRAEQRAVLDGAVLDGTADPDLKQLGGLSYLDRALHETERLHPVAFTLARSAAETFSAVRITRNTFNPAIFFKSSFE